MVPANPVNRHMSPLAAVFTVVLCAIFGANTVAIKISLLGFGRFTAAGVRFLMAAAAITCWAKFSGRNFTIPRRLWGRLSVVCGLFTFQLALFYLGLSKTNASRGALIANIVPFIVLLLAHFFLPDDRITWRKLVGMLLGFTGVALVLSGTTPSDVNMRSGDFIVLAAASLWAINAVYTKKIISDFEPFHLVYYPMLVAGPLYLAAGWLWDTSMFFCLTLQIGLAVIYQGLICAAFGFVAWTTMLQKYGASTLHAFVFIMPIAGVLAGGWLLAEPLTLRIMLALGMVSAGIIVVYLEPRKASPTLPVGRSY